MDFRNVLIAIVLSTVVLIGWATFFEAPIVEQQTAENEITKSEDLTSPSIDEDTKEIKSEITRSDTINKTKRVKIENEKFITETLVTHKNSTIDIVKKEVPIT